MVSLFVGGVPVAAPPATSSMPADVFEQLSKTFGFDAASLLMALALRPRMEPRSVSEI